MEPLCWGTGGSGGGTTASFINFESVVFGNGGGSGFFTSSYVLSDGIVAEGRAVGVGACNGADDGNGFFDVVYSSMSILHCSPNVS